jgi:serine protease Do
MEKEDKAIDNVRRIYYNLVLELSMTPKSITTLKNLAVTALLAVFFIVVGILISSKMHWTEESAAQPTLTQEPSAPVNSQYIQNGESPFVAVAEKVKPQVVNITSEREITQEFNWPFEMLPDPFQDFFNNPHNRQQPQERKFRSPAGGSGIIIDRDGYVLTNNHMVENAKKITVKLEDQREVTAKVIGTDPETDLALIKIDTDIKPEQVATLGNSSNIKIGDWAIAIGNPYGLGWTVTVGVVSALGRSNLLISGGGPSYQDFIQTDASINFGNSGGPLVNIHGEVIGVNAAVNAQAQGIGFAIPIDIAKQIVSQLREKGTVTRGYLGLVPAELTPKVKEGLGMDPDTKGILVDEVQKGTPAEDGGLKAGDVILELDGEQMDNVDHFRFKVADKAPGSKVTMTIWRDGSRKTLHFTLGNRSEHVTASSGGTKEQEAKPWLGIHVEGLDSRYAQQWGIKADAGVLVVDLSDDSPANDALQSQDVIIQVGKTEIKNMDDYQKVARELKGTKDVVLFRVRRGDRTTFVAVDPKLSAK